jgi:hypothetical protein
MCGSWSWSSRFINEPCLQNSPSVEKFENVTEFRTSLPGSMVAHSYSRPSNDSASSTRMKPVFELLRC